MNLSDNITSLKGVGPKKAQMLAKLNIHTAGDLICTFPRRYEDRQNIRNIADLSPDQNNLFRGKIESVVNSGFGRGRGRQVTRAYVSDDTGMLELVFFNASYLAKALKRDEKYVFYGKISLRNGRKQVIHPEFSPEDEAVTGILPIYPLTGGLTQREMRKYQCQVREIYTGIDDYLDEDIIKRNNLCSLDYALSNIHFPEEKQKLLEAKYRLIFDEFFVLLTGLGIANYVTSQNGRGIAFARDRSEEEYIRSMPYRLTGAQTRCIREIVADLESTKRMNRLVQGDVGCGKTAVAEIAMYKACKSGYQSVLMAPTEILARQHYEGISKSFSALGIRTGFLSGSMSADDKREVLEGIRDGSIKVIVGTHALIQPGVKYKNPGLVITDEQHRFGVKQRTALAEKGEGINVLVMTATPIPRTLAAVLYGDMDISAIDEMPPGRQQIITRSIAGNDRNKLNRARKKCYDFVKTELQKGHQAYVVAPLIDESDSIDARSAVQLKKEMEVRFPEYNVGLLHGGMKQDEKDTIMMQFHDGCIDILAATVVIEVGINVPNATVMVIENSERFGLAQLHQLRGRVGRGRDRSYCFLISEGASQLSKDRSSIMEESSDGFRIAEEDLKLRGPGEIFGTRQHGLPDLKLGDLYRHRDIFEKAKKEVRFVLEDDPFLKKEKNIKLKSRVKTLFGEDFIISL